MPSARGLESPSWMCMVQRSQSVGAGEDGGEYGHNQYWRENCTYEKCQYSNPRQTILFDYAWSGDMKSGSQLLLRSEGRIKSISCFYYVYFFLFSLYVFKSYYVHEHCIQKKRTKTKFFFSFKSRIFDMIKFSNLRKITTCDNNWGRILGSWIDTLNLEVFVSIVAWPNNIFFILFLNFFFL